MHRALDKIARVCDTFRRVCIPEGMRSNLTALTCVRRTCYHRVEGCLRSRVCTAEEISLSPLFQEDSLEKVVGINRKCWPGGKTNLVATEATKCCNQSSDSIFSASLRSAVRSLSCTQTLIHKRTGVVVECPVATP